MIEAVDLVGKSVREFRSTYLPMIEVSLKITIRYFPKIVWPIFVKIRKSVCLCV